MPYITLTCPTCSFDVYVKNNVFVDHWTKCIVKQGGEVWLDQLCPSSGDTPPA